MENQNDLELIPYKTHNIAERLKVKTDAHIEHVLKEAQKAEERKKRLLPYVLELVAALLDISNSRCNSRGDRLIGTYTKDKEKYLNNLANKKFADYPFRWENVTNYEKFTLNGGNEVADYAKFTIWLNEKDNGKMNYNSKLPYSLVTSQGRGVSIEEHIEYVLEQAAKNFNYNNDNKKLF